MGEKSILSNKGLKKNRHPIQDYFLGWQCRLRQYAMRIGEGRPSSGMRPCVLLKNGTEVASAATLLLVPDQQQESIQQFRFMAQKTHDPQERFKKAVELLSSSFYQNVEKFSGLMTGVFLKNSGIVKALMKNQYCLLAFDYQQQKFLIPSSVGVLKKKDLEYEFTFWHNYLFNPHLSPEINIISFRPDWHKASMNTTNENKVLIHEE